MLTAEGEVFFCSAREAMTAIDGALVAAHAADRSNHNQSRLGCTADSEMVMRLVVRAASVTARRYESSHFELVETSLLGRTLDRTFDLVLLFGHCRAERQTRAGTRSAQD
jgi:DNA-binding transcriptional LysR family regulator